MQEFFKNWLYKFKDNNNNKYLEDFLYVNLINNHIKLEFINNTNQNLYACFIPKEELLKHITMSNSQDKVLYLDIDDEYYKNPGYHYSAQALYIASQNKEAYYAMWLYLLIRQIQLKQINTQSRLILDLQTYTYEILESHDIANQFYLGRAINLFPDFMTYLPDFESKYDLINILQKQVYYTLGRNYLLLFDSSKENENISENRKEASQIIESSLTP